ncbi:MAG: FAD-binding protein [Chloroflexales bacterium]|nr:FAD-binding protein [Chloroflexales bacterium]
MGNPQTITELATMVRDTTGPIVPRGAGLHQVIGNPARAESTVIDLRDLKTISDYTPSDLTITVGAGMVLGEIQDILAVNRQWLPWDAPQHRDATIGGLLASGLSGPLRHGAGSPRDWLLGMHFVTGDGRIIKSGGKVVKNVAGYDMHKLHIGALGTLGIIAEVSFKLAPLPDADESMTITGMSIEHAHNMAYVLRTPPFNPSAFLIEATPHHIRLWVRWQGAADAVTRQVNIAHVRHPIAKSTTTGSWEALLNTPFNKSHGYAGQLRIGCAPQSLLSLYPVLQALAPKATLHIMPTVGLIRLYAAHIPDITALRAALLPLGAYVVVEIGDDPIRWGPPPPNLAIMHQLKKAWDPDNKLNSGRYVIE